MLHLSWRNIAQALAVVILLGSVASLIWKPSIEGLLGLASAILAFVGSFFLSNAPIQIPVRPDYMRDVRNRENMLKLVRNTWIKGVLEQSLHNAVLIELGMEERIDLVANPWRMELRMTDKPSRMLPAGTKIIDVFNEANVPLLILGEPGSGKTTMLLELARETINRAENDASQPIPVVFNLSSWSCGQSIADWLVAELNTKHMIPTRIGRSWVENDQLLLLFDGLDEVTADEREACVKEINDFRSEHLVPLVVCSRVQEYESIRNRLMVRSAVCLQPLTLQQVDDYLDWVGPDLAAVRNVVQDDAPLRELAKTPLWLSIITLAYRQKTVEEVQVIHSPETRRKHLCDTYAEQMFKRRPGQKASRYVPLQTIHWLSCLSRNMIRQGQSAFLIEWMQPTFLPREVQRWAVTKGAALVLGLVSGLVIGLVVGLLDELVSGLVAGPVWGFMISAFSWPGGLSDSSTNEIEPVEIMHWSWPEARYVWLFLVIGLVGGLVWGLVVGLAYGLGLGLLLMLVVVLFGVPLFALTFGLFVGMVPGEITTRTVPNQGMHRSVRNALIAGCTVMLIVVLVGYLAGCLLGWLGGKPVDGLHIGLSAGLFYGTIIGTALGLEKGGTACLRHVALRVMLWRNNYAPLNYVKFLDYAAERIFLRKVGGGYIFVHRMLMEYFASLERQDAR